MADYIFTYRCRYCGKEFGNAITGEAMATKFLIQTALDLKKEAQHPGEKTIHYAEDHFGIAELIGCKIKGDNTNENDNT